MANTTPNQSLVKQWRTIKGSNSFTISTDKSLLDRQFINNAYGTEEMFWIKPMSAENLETLIANSYILGVYSHLSLSQSSTMVGFARLITDRINFAYVTDVYVDPGRRGLGLGKWLVRCLKEVCEGFPAMRRVLLLVGTDELELVRLYEREFGMEVGFGVDGVVAMTWMPGKEQ